jgi:D-3-phosphoglycerate dehydrogenase
VSAPLSFPRDRIRVLLLEGIHDSAVAHFAAQGYTNVVRVDRALAGAELHDALNDAHIVGLRSRTQLDRAALDAAPKLIAAGCFCIGTNQVDLDGAAARGIPVFNAPHSNTRSVAELVVGLAVMLQRDVFRKSNAVHAGTWPKTAAGSREVRGKTIGIVGYGHIGSQVSVLAEALGMRVRFFDIAPKLPLSLRRSKRSWDTAMFEAATWAQPAAWTIARRDRNQGKSSTAKSICSTPRRTSIPTPTAASPRSSAANCSSTLPAIPCT